MSSARLTSPLAGRRVCVTGAAGFIGGRLFHRLAEAEAQVIGFDRDAATVPEAKNACFTRGELRDEAALGSALADAEVVFHLAATAGHRESMEHPLADFEGNVIGTLRLLDAAAQRAPRARIVFASTRQLYGAPVRLPAPEDHPVAPPDIHSVHKETAEHLVRHHADSQDLRFSILRLTNTYGPGQPLHGPGAGFVGSFIAQALEDGEITILGDPELIRDLNHVDDVVEAFLRAGAPEAPSGTWNLGGPSVSLLSFAETIFSMLLTPERIRSVPLPEDAEPIALGDFYADWSAIHRDLGWAPRVDFELGMTETVRSLREREA